MEETQPVVEDGAAALYADIFRRLLESPRFKAFFEANYELRKYVNDEEKTVQYDLLELPVQIAQEKTVKKISDLMKEQGKIALATESDFTKMTKAKKKLR